MYDSYQERSLEHHGVKGMKWGVRHDRDKTSRYKSSKNSQGASTLENTYNMYMEKASTYKSDLSIAFSRISNIRPFASVASVYYARSDEFNNTIYQQAAEDLNLSDESKVQLAVYIALKKKGVEQYFGVDAYKTNGEIRFTLYSKIDGKAFHSLNSAVSYAKIHYVKQREKNVQGEPVKVSVNKSKSVGKKPASGNDPSVSMKFLKTKEKSIVKKGQDTIDKLVKNTFKKKK